VLYPRTRAQRLCQGALHFVTHRVEADCDVAISAWRPAVRIGFYLGRIRIPSETISQCLIILPNRVCIGEQ